MTRRLPARRARGRHHLDESVIQIREAAHDLSHYLDHLELNPERMHELDTRLAELTSLARKHRIEAEELPVLADHLRAELKELEDNDERHHGLLAELEQARTSFQLAAERLSASRRAAAERLIAPNGQLERRGRLQ